MKKFWNWKVKAATETAPEERTLFLNGTIAEDSWYDDDAVQVFQLPDIIGGHPSVLPGGGVAVHPALVVETAPEERTLFLNGTIAEDSWYDDDVTPQHEMGQLGTTEAALDLIGVDDGVLHSVQHGDGLLHFAGIAPGQRWSIPSWGRSLRNAKLNIPHPQAVPSTR